MGEKYHRRSPMSKVLILVEGYTEERFVKEVLKFHFEQKGIFVIPINLKGVGKYKTINNEVKTLLKDRSAKMVTTMIDFYRIPSDFPNKSQCNSSHTAVQKVELLENGFIEDIDNEKFLPYLQLHEFEALLFSDVSHFSKIPNVGNKISEFEKIVLSKQPEEINDLPNTSPANQIIKILNFYRKEYHGIIVAKSIGLDKMREKCPHFNNWIESIEKLAIKKV